MITRVNKIKLNPNILSVKKIVRYKLKTLQNEESKQNWRL